MNINTTVSRAFGGKHEFDMDVGISKMVLRNEVVHVGATVCRGHYAIFVGPI